MIRLIRSFIWKKLGKCKHCGSGRVKEWNDAHLEILRGDDPTSFGVVCGDCGMITI